jgi:diguanylate cyclase (GGDEF)-like protein
MFETSVPAPPPIPLPEEPSPAAAFGPILLVEDNPLIAHMVRAMLAEGGLPDADLVHVETIADALVALRRRPPCCVLLDLTLPDAEGMDGLLRLRAERAETAVVVLTATDDEGLALAAMQEGAEDYLLKGSVDAALLVRSIRHAAERKRAENRRARHALHDGLTGVPNRELFLDRLTHALARAQRTHVPPAVFFVDLDGFKAINDRLGHAAGDAVLCAAAERLQAAVRPGDTVARFGGDEFTVLCEELNGPQDAVRVARRLADALAQPLIVERERVALTASVGIALAHLEGTAERLVRNADVAMYQAKQRGGGDCELFDEALRAREMERRRIEVGLEEAWERELRILYQPIVALDGEAVVGLEALLRWQHRSGRLIKPEEFLAVAEESGLIVPIGAWVLGAACRDVAAWRAAAPGLSVHVNLSARQLAEPGLVAGVAGALEDSGLSPEALALEVDETALLARPAEAERVLRDLKRLGVRIVLDDFGSGFSSVGALQRFPIDAVKIDRDVVADVAAPEGEMVVRGLLGLAQGLGLAAVAEGVETDEQRRALQRLGCPLAQGFHFAPPLSAPEAERLAHHNDDNEGKNT